MKSSASLDVVYVVRDGEKNEELRYSLRSLSNLPHRNVYIVGYKPNWVRGVVHIHDRNDPIASKHRNAEHHWLAATEIADLSEHFIAMNDDFFITAPVDGVPVLNRGLLKDVIAEHEKYGSDGWYIRGMKSAYEVLVKCNITEPLSYELHIPMVLQKSVVNKIITTELLSNAKKPNSIHLRTLYGNLAGLTGETVSDVKIYKSYPTDNLPRPFASTNDSTFESHGSLIRELFQEKSKYEI